MRVSGKKESDMESADRFKYQLKDHLYMKASTLTINLMDLDIYQITMKSTGGNSKTDFRTAKVIRKKEEMNFMENLD